MRLIDADELSKWISGQSKSPSCPKNESAFGLRIIKHIDRMPTIEPERKTGRWTHAWGTDDAIWKCSECGFEIDAHGCAPVEYLETYKFCPNCGSDNREDIPMEYFENGGT